MILYMYIYLGGRLFMTAIRERIKEEKERVESQTIQTKWIEAYSSVNNDILDNIEQTKKIGRAHV
mgnify:CR=1 FL=1